VGVGLRWTAAAGLACLSEADRERLPATIARARAGMSCDRAWLANRLTVAWLAAGYRKGEAQATAWLGEGVRLLGHVPTDILSSAIDQAVMGSQRGFLPSVGEILKIAEPALRKRAETLRRLEMVEAAAIAPPIRIADEADAICTPDEAAAILRENGLPVTPKAETAAPKPEPTVADYVALGLTENEARDAMSERQRLLRRGTAKTLAEAIASAA
jgi:hypothetical protein